MITVTNWKSYWPACRCGPVKTNTNAIEERYITSPHDLLENAIKRRLCRPKNTMASGSKPSHGAQALAIGTRQDVSRFLQVWLLRLLVFLPGVRNAFLALVERYLVTRRVNSTRALPLRAHPPPSLAPLPPPPVFTPFVATAYHPSSCEDFVSIPSVSSKSIGDSSASSSFYYDLSDAESTDSSVSEDLRALYAMSSVPRFRFGGPSHRPLDPIFYAAEHRIITPRATPPPSPASELDNFISSAPSTAPSSKTSEKSSYHQRVAARIAAKRKERAADPNFTGPRLLYNGKDVYAVAGKMGSGAHGRVMYAKNTDAQELAIKVIHKPKAYRFSSGRDGILNELKALKRVTQNDLAFVCPLLSSWSDENNIYLVMVSCHVLWRCRSV